MSNSPQVGHQDYDNPYMTHTNTLPQVARFNTIGRTVIHCGRDVQTFDTPHDAQHAAAMLESVFEEINNVDLYDALFHRTGD